MNLLGIFWFILPAGFATMAPVFAKIILPKLNCPVDFGKTFKGKRIFGAHKTWRGILFGVIVGWVIFKLQRIVYARSFFVQGISLVDYQQTSSVFGAWISLGALVGDLVKSFFKRQVGVKPGKTWFPYDQLDWIVGTMFFSMLVVPIPIQTLVIVIVFALVLHLIVKYVGFVVGINKDKI